VDTALDPAKLPVLDKVYTLPDKDAEGNPTTKTIKVLSIDEENQKVKYERCRNGGEVETLEEHLNMFYENSYVNG
jgi:hypothetical protein